MNILQNIQNMLGQSSGGESNKSGGLSSLLGPAALGGIAGALLTSKAARGIAAGALIAGGGAYLWQKYKGRMQTPAPTQTANPPAGYIPQTQPSTVNQARAERLIRALVYAAKSDGHIDPKEEQALSAKIHSLNIGPEAEGLIQRAMSEPLDPNKIAQGVTGGEEALELYTISYLAIDVDHFMERGYLDALARALQIPDEVKTALEADLAASKTS